jgi:hypothetical protein
MSVEVSFPAKVDWSDPAVIEKLQFLQGQGHTAQQVAEHFGCSRNAAIGALHRHGRADAPNRQPGRRRVARPPTPEQVKAVLAEAGGVKPAHIIATETGLSKWTVTTIFQNAGIDRRAAATAVGGKASAERSMALRIQQPLPEIAGEWQERFAEGYQGQHGRVAMAKLQQQHCKFPIDQADGRTLSCGLARQEGSSYCPDHHARCVSRASPKMVGKRGWFLKGPAR